MYIVKMFNSAGSTGHVFLLKKGKARDMGLAFSGLIGPTTTVAVVPTAPQLIPFAIEARTKDKQTVVVHGHLNANLEAKQAVKRFDFTVDPKTGNYLNNWDRGMQAIAVEHVLRTVLQNIQSLPVEEAIRSQMMIEDAITMAFSELGALENGIIIQSCSVSKIKPKDNEVEDAIGAEERQILLTEADKAMHERRLKASANDRSVRKYESETALELEKKRAALLDEQATNKRKEADADAEAMKVRMAPMQELNAGKLLAAAVMTASEKGNFDQLTITSELLAAVGRE